MTSIHNELPRNIPRQSKCIAARVAVCVVPRVVCARGRLARPGINADSLSRPRFCLVQLLTELPCRFWFRRGDCVAAVLGRQGKVLFLWLAAGTERRGRFLERVFSGVLFLRVSFWFLFFVRRLRVRRVLRASAWIGVVIGVVGSPRSVP